MNFKEAHEKTEGLKKNLGRVIRGKDEIISLAITALVSRGHLLIEDVPGVGKTTLAHGLARSISCSFQRIQFTSDLLPSDVIGVTVFNQTEQRFEFRPGPLFANIVLADEINRATPKTQSALLEAMNDRQVSVDKYTHLLPSPFMLLATQNPLEFAGTFPLPESQLDRFSMSLKIGYPDEIHEREIIRSSFGRGGIDSLVPVVSTTDIEEMQSLVSEVKVHEDLIGYIMAITTATRQNKAIRLGASPRAAMMLYSTAQAYAFVSGRDYCLPDDIKRLSVPVLAHRIVPMDRSFDEGSQHTGAIIEEILSTTPVPV